MYYIFMLKVFEIRKRCSSINEKKAPGDYSGASREDGFVEFVSYYFYL
jgi:hypothetical protein